MVIKGHTELLLNALPQGDASARKVELIDRAADRAASLTRQLLAFSRMQVLQPRVINLNKIVEDMGKLIPRLLGEDVDLVVRTSPDLGAIRADASQMEQVIMNLAVNARDAMPERRTTRHRNIQHRTRPLLRQRAPGRHSRSIHSSCRQRHRHRHGSGNAGAHLRAVFHHQGAREGNRPRPFHRVRRRETERRFHLGL